MNKIKLRVDSVNDAHVRTTFFTATDGEHLANSGTLTFPTLMFSGFLSAFISGFDQQHVKRHTILDLDLGLWDEYNQRNPTIG